MKTLRETAVTTFVGVAVWLSMLADAPAGAVKQARAEPDKISTWEGFERRDFKIDGRNCLLVVPASPARRKPWIWRTEFFGHQPQADLALLHKGFHLAYMDVQNMYGAPVALDHMDRFHEHLTAVRGLAPKTVLEGFSRGGLFALNWAARHPERVACVYNDAPVCDFKSWPGGKGKGKGSPGDWQKCLKVYGLTEQQALEYNLNPVDNLEGLAKAKVPLLHVCGDADEVVPIDENTRLVEKRYQKLGGPITVIAKPGVGHHPHSLENPDPIVAFVLKHTIGGAAALILPESPSDYRVFNARVGTPDRSVCAACSWRRRGSCAVVSSKRPRREKRPPWCAIGSPSSRTSSRAAMMPRSRLPRAAGIASSCGWSVTAKYPRKPPSNTSASVKCSSSPASRTRPTTAPKSKRRPAAWSLRSTAPGGFWPTIRNQAFRTEARAEEPRP